jgi:hypothetical protein
MLCVGVALLCLMGFPEPRGRVGNVPRFFMEKLNENQCIRCKADMDETEIVVSHERLDGITLCQYCQKEVPDNEGVHGTCANKLKLLLSQQAYEVNVINPQRGWYSKMYVDKGENKAEIIVYDSTFYGEDVEGIDFERKGGFDMDAYVRARRNQRDPVALRVPSNLLDGYPNRASTNFFVQLALIFSDLEKERLRHKKNVEVIDNKDFLTFQLTTHAKRLEDLKRFHLKRVDEIDYTLSDIWGFLSRKETTP